MVANNKDPFPKNPRERSAKEATLNEEKATHRVMVEAPGCGTSVDMDLFRAAGLYSDGSGCGFGVRDHEWYVQGYQNAMAMARRLRIQAKSLDELNGFKIGITVKVKKIRKPV